MSLRDYLACDILQSADHQLPRRPDQAIRPFPTVRRICEAIVVAEAS